MGDLFMLMTDAAKQSVKSAKRASMEGCRVIVPCRSVGAAVRLAHAVRLHVGTSRLFRVWISCGDGSLWIERIRRGPAVNVEYGG